MDKIIVWGIGDYYNNYKNNLDFEVLKGNIEIVAMVSREHFSNTLDGKPVIFKEDISKFAYDYIVVFANRFDEIKNEALALGITREKIIDGSIFRLPCFDFSRYSSLIKNPVTIISDDCWGGFLYSYLKLKATSPFRNFYIQNDDYVKLCNDLKYYLSQPLKMEREGEFSEGIEPMGSLGEDDKKIYITFNHYETFERSKREWERRLSRVNFDRLFIKMSIPGPKETTYKNATSLREQFIKIPFEHKICFSNKSYIENDIIALPRWLYFIANNYTNYSTLLAIHARNMEFLVKQIDILKLLCGEKDYLREIN